MNPPEGYHELQTCLCCRWAYHSWHNDRFVYCTRDLPYADYACWPHFSKLTEVEKTYIILCSANYLNDLPMFSGTLLERIAAWYDEQQAQRWRNYVQQCEVSNCGTCPHYA